MSFGSNGGTAELQAAKALLTANVEDVSTCLFHIRSLSGRADSCASDRVSELKVMVCCAKAKRKREKAIDER